MAHRPITIDGAGADGSAEGADGVEPGPSNEHGGDGTYLHRSSGRSNGPSSLERPRQRCGSPPCRERVPASQAPQIPALGMETFTVYVKLYTRYTVSGTYAR